MGQGYNEAYDLSEGEEESRRKAEVEEKMKSRDEKRAAVKAELKKKKNTGTGGLFGEAIGPGEDDPMFKPAEEKQEESDPVTKGGKSSGHETAEDALNGGSSESLQKSNTEGRGQEDSTNKSAKGGSSASAKSKTKRRAKAKPKQD
jgi:hypothetical protein